MAVSGHSVFDPGATTLADGTTLLLCRVEDRRGLSHLCAARSANGLDGWVIDPAPTFLPDPVNHPEELWASRIRASPSSASCAALPPRRVGGDFALLHRPIADSGAHTELLEWLDANSAPDLLETAAPRPPESRLRQRGRRVGLPRRKVVKPWLNWGFTGGEPARLAQQFDRSTA